MSAKKINGEYYNKRRFSTILNDNVNKPFSSPAFSRSPLYKSYSEANPSRIMRYQKLTHKSGLSQDYMSPNLSIVRRKSTIRGDTSSSGRYSSQGINRAASVNSSFPFCRPSRSDITQMKPTTLVQSMKVNSHIMRNNSEKDSIVRALQIMESKKRNFPQCDISDYGENSLSDDLSSLPNSKRQRMISGSSNLDGISTSSSVTRNDNISKLSKQDTFCYTSMRDISTGLAPRVDSCGLGGRKDPFKEAFTSNSGSYSNGSPNLSRASTPSHSSFVQFNQVAEEEVSETPKESVDKPIPKRTNIRRRISYMTPSQIESQLSNRSAAVELMRLDSKERKLGSLTRSMVTQTDGNSLNTGHDNSVKNKSLTDKPLSVTDLIANIDKNRKKDSPLENVVANKSGAKDDYMQKRLSRIRTLIAKFSEGTNEPSTSAISTALSNPVVPSLTSRVNLSIPAVSTTSVLNPVPAFPTSTPKDSLTVGDKVLQPVLNLSTPIACTASSQSFTTTGYTFTSPSILSSAGNGIAIGSSNPQSAPQEKEKSVNVTVCASLTNMSGILPKSISTEATNAGSSTTTTASLVAKPALFGFGLNNDKVKTFTATTTLNNVEKSTPNMPSVSQGVKASVGFASSKEPSSEQTNSVGSAFKFGLPASQDSSVNFKAPISTSTNGPTSSASSNSIFNFHSSSTQPNPSLFDKVTKTTQSSSTANTQKQESSIFPSIASNSSQQAVNQFSFTNQKNEQKSLPLSSNLFSSTQNEQKPSFAATIPSCNTTSASIFSFTKSENQVKKDNATNNIFSSNSSSTSNVSSPFSFGSKLNEKSPFPTAPNNTNTVTFGNQNGVQSNSVNLFGASKNQSSNLFGITAGANSSQKSIFGESGNTGTSIVFGGAKAAAPATNTPSLFKSETAQSSLFGNSVNPNATSLFSFGNRSNPVAPPDVKVTNTAANLFGNSQISSSNAMFSNSQPQTNTTMNAFGSTQSAQPFAFGNNLENKGPAAAVVEKPNGGFNFSTSSNAASGGFNFGATPSNSVQTGSSSNIFNLPSNSTPGASSIRRRTNRSKR